MLEHLTALEIVLMTVILLLAGLTKGVLGVGLPLLAVPLLSQLVPVPLAIVTLAVSQVLSNGFQAFQGGNFALVWRRFWSLFVALVAALFAGARLLVSLDHRVLGLILGTILLVLTLLNQIPRLFRIEVRHERLMSPLVGALAGFLGGVSSFYGPVLLMYMVALRLEKQFFISAVSTALVIGAVPLLISLILYGAMGRDGFILSALAVLPVFGGLLVGQAIQKRMPQEAFRKGIFVIMLIMGASLVLRAIFE